MDVRLALLVGRFVGFIGRGCTDSHGYGACASAHARRSEGGAQLHVEDHHTLRLPAISVAQPPAPRHEGVLRPSGSQGASG